MFNKINIQMKDVACSENGHFKFSREQREAIGLLSIGTFLEYFDLMLYVHMAIVLDDLFFPNADPNLKSFRSAFSFCSIYFLRPFGSLLFGYIGDLFGRRSVVILTTAIMSLCCITIAALPTYENIGIIAPIALTVCRMLQGMSAGAESTGVEIYLTESIKPPAQYPMVASVTVFSAIGTMAAIGVGAICTSAPLLENTIPDAMIKNAWRLAFVFGATVGLIGTVARSALKEASEFANKMLVKKTFEKVDPELFTEEPKVPLSTSIAYFFIQCARAPCFYFIYIYCTDVLKNTFGFTHEKILSNNLWVSALDTLGLIALAYLSYRIAPLKILKAKLYIFFATMAMFPIAMHFYNNSSVIFIFQCIGTLLVFDHIPASPIFFKYFPVLKRFRYAGFISGIAKLASQLISSFGMVAATKRFGYQGIFLIMIPAGIAFFVAVSYFERKEKQRAKADEENNYVISY